MADAGCSYYYESAEERVQEVKDESTFENIEEKQQTASEPQRSTNKDKPRNLVFVSVTVASWLVVFGLAIAGIILFSREKLQLDQAKKMYESAAAELHGQGQKLNDSMLEKLELEVEELRAQNKKLNNSLLGKLESDVKDLRAQNTKLVEELESELKQRSENNRKLNNKLVEKLELEVEERRKENRELGETFQEKLSFEINESFRILQETIKKQASKQNQTINNLQRLIQHNEMRQNQTHVELLRGATSCAELRDKYGVLKSGIYRMKQSGSRHPVYHYCDFQLRTGLHTCDSLLKELGNDFEAAYFWVREGASTQPNFKFCLKRPSSCKEFAKLDKPATGGMANIFPISGSLTSKMLYCDTDGWTVFQRRKNGSVDFYRGWGDYVKGFGDMNGEFWLGLETIYQLTKDRDYKLRVDLEDFYGNKTYAEYGHFSISSASDGYRLSVSSYSGNAGDSLAYSNGMRFSTKDNDNDELSDTNCAVGWHGAWWYKACQRSNLNGKYYSSKGIGAEGVVWYFWKNEFEYLKYTEIKFKKKN